MLLVLVITSLLLSVFFLILIVPFQHLAFIVGVCKCILLCQELYLAIHVLIPLVRYLSFQADQRHMFGRLE